MLVTILVCLRQNLDIFPDANAQTSQTCHQQILSPISVTNINVAFCTINLIKPIRLSRLVVCTVWFSTNGFFMSAQIYFYRCYSVANFGLFKINHVICFRIIWTHSGIITNIAPFRPKYVFQYAPLFPF